MSEIFELACHALPMALMGEEPLSPQNLTDGADRLAHLDAMLAYVRTFLLQRPPEDAVRHVIAQLPLADLLSVDHDEDGAWRTELTDGARHRVAFDRDALTVAFLDGRTRDIERMLALPTGARTPELARLLGALTRGAPLNELAALAPSLDIEPILEELTSAELVTAASSPTPRSAPALHSGKGDRVTWLGHAGLLVQTGGAAVAVDPLLRPHIHWRPNEIDRVFRDDNAEARWSSPYGPDGPRLAPPELPPLDAVLITHQDIDHFDPGVLMCLPQETTFVVPRSTGAPWDIDLRLAIHRILGPSRKVICLGHGETIELNGLRITAIPFRHEMPHHLPHGWNCYLMDTGRSQILATADASLTDDVIDLLIERLDPRRASVLFARAVHRSAPTPGLKDDVGLLNFERLWGWYTPVSRLLAPVEPLGIHADRLSRLARAAELDYFFPYASGSAPWFRVPDRDDPLYIRIGNLQAGDVDQMQALLDEIGRIRMFPARLAAPVAL